MQQLIKTLLACFAFLLFTSQKAQSQYILLTSSHFSISDLEITLQALKQYANQVYIALPVKSSENEKIKQLARKYGMTCVEDDVLYSDVASKKSNTLDISLYDQRNSLVQQFNTQDLNENTKATIHKTLSQTYDYSSLFWEPIALNDKTYVSFNNIHSIIAYVSPDTNFSISSHYFEIDTTSHMLRKSLTNNGFSPIPDDRRKSRIAIHGCSINKDATINILVSYNGNYNKPDLPYARKISMLTLNSKKEIIANTTVDHNETNDQISTGYNLFGDSVLTLTNVSKATNTYNVALYRKKDKQFTYEATLPIQVNSIFEKLFPNNFVLPNIYRYPYFTTLYDNAIYNHASNSFIHLLPDKTYNTYINQIIMDNAGDKNINTRKVRKYYQIHDLYYNKANDKLYVVYHENNKCYLNIYDKENKLLKTIHLDKSFGNSNSEEYYYSFNEQFKTLVQSFQINKESQSHTIPINFL